MIRTCHRNRPGGGNAFLGLLFLGALLMAPAARCHAGIIPAEVRRQMLGPFTSSQIDALEEMLQETGREGLPAHAFVPRLVEAAAKRIPYGKLESVLSRKIAAMRRANRLLRDEVGRGHRTETMSEDILLLTELVERTLADDEWRYVAVRAGRTLKLRAIIERARMLVLLKERGYPSSESREVAAALLLTDTPDGAALIDLLSRYPSSRAAAIVVDELNHRSRPAYIGTKLKDAYREETVREAIDARRPER